MNIYTHKNKLNIDGLFIEKNELMWLVLIRKVKS